MKRGGGGYLIYLGISLLRVTDGKLVTQDAAVRSLPKLYFDGAFSNVANPKIAIFYFAFLPQFIELNGGSPGIAIFVLGSCFALLTFLIKAPIGISAGQLSGWIKNNPLYLKTVYRISGVLLISLGAKMILSDQSH